VSAGVTVAIVETDKLAAFAEIAPTVSKQVQRLVYLGGGNASALETIRNTGISVFSWSDFVDMGKSKAVQPTPPAPEDIACIMYTRYVED